MTPTFIKQRIDFTEKGFERSGITVRYTKSNRAVHVSGWHDTCCGIEGGEIPLGDFLKALGITLKDCQKAFAEGGK